MSGGSEEGAPGGDPETPPAAIRDLLTGVLPNRAWCRDFVEELDQEYGRRARSGRWRANAWYLRQLVAPDTVRFVVMMRRRAGARRTNGQTGRGRMTTGRSGWDGWVQDARQAWRGVLREPQVAFFVVLILALGIGANGAVFGVADRLFLGGPPHVRQADEVVRLYLHFDASGDAEARTSPWIPHRTAVAIQDAPTAFSGLAVYRMQRELAEVGGSVRALQVAPVGPSYFQLFGPVPVLGRFFGGDGGDRSELASSARPAVLSHQLWTSAFDARRDVLGERVTLADAELTVVGIAPRGFSGPHVEGVDLWIPLDEEDTTSRNWFVAGRIPGLGADGGRAAVAARQANAIHERTDPGPFFQWARDGRVVTAPIGSDAQGEEPAEASIARLLLGVSVLLLLVGIANVVHLLLARLDRRRREVAVRVALGAGRWRLVRLLLLESLLLSLIAGAASLPVAHVAGAALRSLLLPEVAWTGSPLDPRVLLVTVIAVVLSGLLVALLPARAVDRTDVSADLRTGGGGGRGRRARLHALMAAVQVGLSAVLLAGAGLFGKSFMALRTTDLGMDAARATAVSLRSLDASAIPTGSEEERALYRRALAASLDDPGVEAAGLAVGLPFFATFSVSVHAPGTDSVPALPGGGPYVSAVDAGYFDAVGTSVLRGRTFSAADVERGAAAVVVSESMADALWQGRDPLQQCLRVGGPEQPCQRVIGVVEDVHRSGFREPPSMQYYVPFGREEGFSGMELVVRPGPGGARTLERLRATLLRLDASVHHVETRTILSALEPQIRPWRLGASVLTAVGSLALVVSVLGVYGVLSYLVTQRRRELGIRMALGASRSRVRGWVLGAGLKATTAGLLLGGAILVASRPWVEPLLFETGVVDPAVLVAVAVTLVVAATAACLLPARQAARIDPARSLSAE